MPKALFFSAVYLYLSIFTFLLTSDSQADDIDKPQELVDLSRETLERFLADPNMIWFRDHAQTARAILIVPKLVKAGLVFGGAGGSGILLAREEKTGIWSDPAFYTLGAVSWGLQFGIQSAEVALMVTTKKGLDSLLSTKLQLGADASLAAGPVGTGAQVATADILQFSRSKGVYIGLTLEGGVISVRQKWNNAYYGKEVRPLDILIRRNVSNQHAYELRKALTNQTLGK